MISQHAGNFLHGFNLRVHRFRTPLIQKHACPVGRLDTPRKAEIPLSKGSS
jgi:hypothetical protein